MLSSSAIQNNAFNQLVQRINNLNIPPVPNMTWLGTATVTAGNPPNALPTLSANWQIQFYGIIGTNWCMACFTTAPSINPNAITNGNAFNICNTQNWDNAFSARSGNSGIRPLFQANQTGVMGQSLATPNVNRQAIIRAQITTAANVQIFFQPFNGTLSTVATATPIQIPPIFIILNRALQ